MWSRLMDIVVSAVCLVILFPLLLVISLVARLAFGSVFFTQLRPGMNGRLFRMVKFRTMNELVDAKGELLPDRDRLTPLGHLLRSCSLDELPELWNVLRGDMSLVGPRPLLPEYLPLYNERQRRRHEVRPGITGWAQINGRNSLSWDEKFELDIWYVDNRSIFLDLRIMFITLKKVVAREGINADRDATMPKFTGNKCE
ncbi:sugar transferase [Pseudomonas sp. MTM4]|uniref:sugar transferase n=1 Tax=unclassified Pseudomonas TaxID=196821 RepID=UPI0018D1F8B3|nr:MULTISPECIES: sugar transferase [unclassified Pseudomonas]MBC8651634.1 sugar transferase [Pseudomonas sp. MT4]QXY91340.1 sugar transferase [Pseudomonas sp. MTM4]